MQMDHDSIFIMNQNKLIRFFPVSQLFEAGNCIKKADKSCDEGGFGGPKKIDSFFFHNLKVIVSQ